MYCALLLLLLCFSAIHAASALTVGPTGEEGNYVWGFGSYPPLTVAKGTEVRFEWSAEHTLNPAASAQALNACNLSPNEVAGIEFDESTQTFSYVLKTASLAVGSKVFLGCSPHCFLGMKVTITVDKPLASASPTRRSPTTRSPTARPVKDTVTIAPSPVQTASPTTKPSVPSRAPTSKKPTSEPSTKPSKKPTPEPTSKPSKAPTSRKPTPEPTSRPTKPTTLRPSTLEPTSEPTTPTTLAPTRKPTRRPTDLPTRKPTRRPTLKPSTKAMGL